MERRSLLEFTFPPSDGYDPEVLSVTDTEADFTKVRMSESDFFFWGLAHFVFEGLMVVAGFGGAIAVLFCLVCPFFICCGNGCFNFKKKEHQKGKFAGYSASRRDFIQWSYFGYAISIMFYDFWLFLAYFVFRLVCIAMWVIMNMQQNMLEVIFILFISAFSFFILAFEVGKG